MSPLSTPTHIWMRAEQRPAEHRAPLTPRDAQTLVAAGIEVTVEECPWRTYPAQAYADAGCRIVPAGLWFQAPPNAYVLGIKELPTTPDALRHTHIYFSHSYKGQSGAGALLRRFQAGGGTILDLEYLTDGGRRLAAFGYWAGYVGAALAVLHARGHLGSPLEPTTREALDAVLRAHQMPEPRRALVIGALGRCGTGARAALTVAGISTTAWDLEETRALDRAAILEHDLLVNAVLTVKPATPFVTRTDAADPARRLSVIADVTCDVGSPYPLIPIYDAVTTWSAPTRRVADTPPLDVIAIDNLPSLLPRESSDAFSTDLLPHLLTVDVPDSAWSSCRQRFHEACRTTIAESEVTHV